MRYTPMASAFAAAALFVLPGCGGKGTQNNAVITGTVLYKGAPIKGGNMTFHSDKGIYSSTIDENGRFVLRDAPTGTLRVTIETEALNPGPPKGAAGGGGQANARAAALIKEREMRGASGGSDGPKMGTYEERLAKYTKIPAKYADKVKTDLKIEAVNGKQDVTLELLE